MWYEFEHEINIMERKSKMQYIWIRIGIALILRWFKKQDNNNPVIKKLIEANSSTAIEDVFKSKEMEDVAADIIATSAEEPLGNILSMIFGRENESSSIPGSI